MKLQSGATEFSKAATENSIAAPGFPKFKRIMQQE